MAAIVPNDALDLARAGRGAYGRDPALELQTLRVLAEQLHPALTVYHSVHWARYRAGRTAYGEIDFIVANAAGDLVVIEQKNGRVVETPEGLSKLYPDGQENITSKIERSVSALRDRFKADGGGALNIETLLYLPDHHIKAGSAVGLPPDCIVDAADRKDLARIVARRIAPAAETDHGRRVQAFLIGAFSVGLSTRAYQETVNTLSAQILADNADLADRIDMSPLRLRLRGPAGSGKTLAGRRFHQRALERGVRSAFLCFNRPLAEWLQQTVQSDKGIVDTVDGLCARVLRQVGQGPIVSGKPTNSDFERAREAVVALPLGPEWQFAHLVVDEAQDIDRERWEFLRLFLAPDPDIVLLDDPEQRVRAEEPFQPDGFVTLRLPASCRTPGSIARTLEGAIPEIPFRTSVPAEGLGVGLHEWQTAAEQIHLAETIVRDLLRRGFAAADIVLLSVRGRGNAALAGKAQLGPYRLAHATGAFDAQGREVLSEGDFSWDTVRRFKGREAPAVILLDVAADDPLSLRIVHTGLTRATLRCEVLAAMGSPMARRLSGVRTGTTDGSTLVRVPAG